MSQSSPEGITLSKGSTLVSAELSINEEKVLSVKQEKKYSDEDVKFITLKFFYYWWNAPGNNTEQGFDEWFKEYRKE
jgi:hypothetical protein